VRERESEERDKKGSIAVMLKRLLC
jgi:hypothetical protein